MNSNTAPAGAGAPRNGKKKAAPKKLRMFATFCVASASTVLSLFLVFCFLMYGPIPYFRSLWVATAMETGGHKWLASLFFDSKTISAIVAKGTVTPIFKSTDPTQVSDSGKNPKDNATTLPTSPADGEHIINGVGFIKLRGTYGDGWVIKVYDPSRVKMGIAENYGTHGERISDMVTRLGVLAGVNAGGFVAPGGHGNGGEADQIFIYNGKVISNPNPSGKHDIIGITYDHKLVLGEYSTAEMTKQNFQYGVEFGPFLIMNGKPLDVSYSSLNPRTAIGQSKDGTFIFVVIDGRSTRSIGAYWADVQKIMEANGAYNAAELDGGSSTAFIFKGKVKNVPSTPIGERYVPDAFLITMLSGSSSGSK